jgi:hypothetical protein
VERETLLYDVPCHWWNPKILVVVAANYQPWHRFEPATNQRFAIPFLIVENQHGCFARKQILI